MSGSWLPVGAFAILAAALPFRAGAQPEQRIIFSLPGEKAELKQLIVDQPQEDAPDEALVAKFQLRLAKPPAQPIELRLSDGGGSVVMMLRDRGSLKLGAAPQTRRIDLAFGDARIGDQRMTITAAAPGLPPAKLSVLYRTRPLFWVYLDPRAETPLSKLSPAERAEIRYDGEHRIGGPVTRLLDSGETLKRSQLPPEFSRRPGEIRLWVRLRKPPGPEGKRLRLSSSDAAVASIATPDGQQELRFTQADFTRLRELVIRLSRDPDRAGQLATISLRDRSAKDPVEPWTAQVELE